MSWRIATAHAGLVVFLKRHSPVGVNVKSQLRLGFCDVTALSALLGLPFVGSLRSHVRRRLRDHTFLLEVMSHLPPRFRDVKLRRRL